MAKKAEKKRFALLVPFKMNKSETDYIREYQIESRHKTEKAALKYQKDILYQRAVVVEILAEFDMEAKRV
jgi:hypothetical protein